MTAHHSQRGGAAVGQLRHLDPVEAGAVLYLRLWSDGPAGQDNARSDFDIGLGADAGQTAFSALEQICGLCVRYGRRPLIRHHLSCSCVGADESCFANMVAAASQGDREDAIMMAALIVRADLAPCLAGLAESLGLALRRMAAIETACPDPVTTRTPSAPRLH
ncbi:hypothetical protein LCL97_10270 [Seohaeicola saemankumensis]|nr:hypothetical protein [Seohaeicola saemankumensis]MCA0871215.1 hypothetical protein [Seohaeicola saemankumensis]